MSLKKRPYIVPELLCRDKVTTIVGTPGRDHITGTPGSDVVHGWGGNDILKGGTTPEDVDYMNGGYGNDNCTGTTTTPAWDCEHQGTD